MCFTGAHGDRAVAMAAQKRAHRRCSVSAGVRQQRQLVQITNTKWRATAVSRFCEMLCATAAYLQAQLYCTQIWTAALSPELSSG